MFGLFKKDPVAKLEKEYQKIMEEAMHVQRSGDLKAYARKIEASEKILEQIQALKNK
jgi:TRAP-type mannitol/chloroaromatic compound transport system substrate-binding protein